MKKDKNCKKIMNPLCVDLLFSLSEKEIKNCYSILSCTYFNTDQYVTKLFKILVKQVVELNKNYTVQLKNVIYQEVFNPEKTKATLSKEEDNKLRAKYSDLTKVILRYLTTEALNQHPAFEDELILKSLFHRKQFKLLQRRVNTSVKKLFSSNYRSYDFHQHAYILEENNLLMNRFLGKGFEKEKLQELNHHLDTTYLIDKLKTYITLISVQGTSENVYDYSSMDAIKPLLSLNPYKTQVTIRLYAAAVDLMKKRTEKEYYRLLKLLDSLSAQFPKAEVEFLYDIATNFCTVQIRQGSFDYKNLFDLYQLMHQQNFLIRDEHIDENTLKNIVTVCCRTTEFKWAEELIESCFPYLRPDIRVSVQNFNLGAVAFYQKQYDKAHHFFSKVQEINLSYDINNRLMLAKTFYETDKYYDLPTFTHFNSEQRFFERTKLLKSGTAKSYKHFFVILKDLYRIKHGVTKKSLEQLQQKLHKMDNVVTKDWLMEKMGEIA